MQKSSESGPVTALQWVLLAALMIAHVSLAVWYASGTPYRTEGRILSAQGAPAKDIGAPDERQHANYIAKLMKGEGFPVFNPKDPDLYENYQSHQPPLYYLVAKTWASVDAVAGVELPEDGKRLRLLNSLIGSVTILGVFMLGFWSYRDSWIALTAAAFAAMLPMNVALSSAISNDVLLICLCTWVLALLAKCINDGWNLASAVGMGALAGAALLTKTTAVALLPLFVLAIFIPQTKRPTLGQGLVPLLIALLIVAPWWVRNQQLYGDPLAAKAFNEAFTGSPQAASFIEAYGMKGYLMDWVGWWTARSFFGAFGYMDIWLNETGRPAGSAPNAIYRVLLAGFALGLFGWIYWLRGLFDSANKARKSDLGAQLILGAFTILVLGLFLRFNLQYFQGQARYVLPALGPISAAFAVGVCSLAGKKKYLACAVVILVLGGVAGYAGQLLPTEFARRTGA